ncbi:MAG TPA: hypothetical protein VHH36_01520, partial [Candidatus Thermoplasmatota archaeon]|nr:hypothetical protein [Candidatus Thermoplasmatota archaeon]
MRVALVLVLLLAGCASAPDAPRPPAGPAAPVAREAFLTSAMTLAPAAEPETVGVRTGSFFLAWSQGADYVAWLGEPRASGALVDDLTVHLALRATGPVVESARFP